MRVSSWLLKRAVTEKKNNHDSDRGSKYDRKFQTDAGQFGTGLPVFAVIANFHSKLHNQ